MASGTPTLAGKCVDLYERLNTFVTNVITRDVTPKITNLNTEVWGSNTQTGDSRIDDLETDVSSLNTDVASLNDSITNLEYDTGWQTLTIDNNKFAHYDNDAQVLQIRKVGRIVELTGSLKNTASITLNATEVNVATIPIGYRPTKHIFGLMQGSGIHVFEVTVNKANGNLNLSRCRSNTSTYPSMASGSWFPIHLTWII